MTRDVCDQCLRASRVQEHIPGLDDTNVKLFADPIAADMHTVISFESNAGSLRVDWKGVPTRKNPSTSADVPLTVIKALRNLTSSVCYGP